MNKNEYNLESFKFIRQEIEKRLDIHYKMVIWKITLAGAIVAFLLDKGTSIQVPPFIVASIFLFLMDVVIVENLGKIKAAGAFIKQNIENTELSAIKWESNFAQAGGNWGCFSVQGYLFGIWIIAPSFLILGFIFEFDSTSKVDIAVLIIATYMGAYSLYQINTQLGLHSIPSILDAESPLE
mgnify:CR=1 FL=1